MTISDSPVRSSNRPKAVDRLASFVSRLSGAGVSSMDDESATEAITMLAAADLKQKKQTDAAKGLVQDIKRYRNECMSARTQYEREWFKNLDMAQGRQYTDWNDRQQKMVARPGLKYEPRLTINVVEPIMRTELSKVGGSHPNVTIAPASNEEEDLMAAKAGEQIWEWFYDSEHVDTTLRQANWWASHTGNGFIKTYWDDGAEDVAVTAFGKIKNTVEDPNDLNNWASGGLEPRRLAPAKPTSTPGAIKQQVVTPFHLYVPDLTELDLHRQDYVLHVYPMNLQRAKAKYRDFVDPDWQPTKVSGDTIVPSGYLLGMKGTNTSVQATVIVVEAWIKPNVNPRLPQGGLVVLVEDEIVAMSSDGFPYEGFQFPFDHITNVETGTFYRKSVIPTITPIQDDLNRMYSQMTKHRNLMLAPMMFYDAGSVDVSRIATKAGTWIPIALGSNKPTPVPLPEVPQTFWQLIAKLKDELDNISGQHDVSRGVAPGADTAASAVSVLQEQDNNFLFDRLSSIEKVTQGMAQKTLALAIQFWDTPRLVKIVGEDGQFDVMQLQGSDLSSATDVRVESGTGLPEGKAARIAFIRDLMKDGVISPVDGMKALEMGNLTRVYRATKIDEEQASRENLAMKALDEDEATRQLGDAQMLAVFQDTEDEAEEGALAEQVGGPAQAPGMGADPSMSADPSMGADPSASPFAGVDDPGLGIQGAGAQPPAVQAPPTAPADPAQAGAMQDPTAGMPGIAQDPSVNVDPTAPAPVLAPQPTTPTPFPVHDWDNHAIHIQVHENYMKGQEFERLPAPVKQVFIAHRQAHIEAAGLQARSAATQGMPGGAPNIGAGSGYAGAQSPAAPTAAQ